MAGEGGKIIRNVFGNSYKEAQHISKDASKGSLDFKSPNENTFYGRKGGKKFNDYEPKKDDTLLVVKVEGPLDNEGNKIKKTKQGEKYWFKATFNRAASKNEYKRLSWQVKVNNVVIPWMFDYSQLNGGSQIIQVKIPCYEMRVYAFFVSPDDSVSVQVQLKGLKLPILILQSKHRKGRNDDNTGTSRDMLYNDYSENEAGFTRLKEELMREQLNIELENKKNDTFPLIKPTDDVLKSVATSIAEKKIKNIKSFCKKDNEELFSIFRNDMWYYASGNLKNVAYDMVDTVKTNRGGEYSNNMLTNAVIEHDKSKEFILGVENAIKNYLRNKKGVIDDLEIDDDSNGILYKILQNNNVKRPIFHDKMSGLGITINDVWAYQVYISSYQLKGNQYEISLRVLYWDHFGLDYPDIQKFNQDIFQAWFVLQHFRGFKPLLTKIDITHKFKGNF